MSITERNDTIASETDNEETSLNIDSSNTSTDGGSKRSMSIDNSTTPIKKVRKKPEPKIIENMEEYFNNGTLNQLTTATLRYWLKEKSLHCTTREKKAHLIDKVRKHFLEATT